MGSLVPVPGFYQSIGLIEQHKMDLPASPCQDSPGYSFARCTRRSLSGRVGCRLPWDPWSHTTVPLCSTLQQYRVYEELFLAMNHQDVGGMVEMTGCRAPCHYREYRFIGDMKETSRQGV